MFFFTSCPPETLKWQSLIAILLAVAIFLVVLLPGIFSDMLRETKPNSSITSGFSNFLIKDKDKRPYSFHKFQTWLWTLIIAPCFVLYWGYNDKIYINQTALILLSIQLGSTLIAEGITEVQKQKALKDSTNAPNLKSVDVKGSSLLADILRNDLDGISIPRLQNLVFTIAFAGIYITSFFTKCPMQYPEFEPVVYALMGISTTGFLVGKGMKL